MSITVQVDKYPPLDDEFNARTIFSIESLKLKQSCGFFTPFNDSCTPYRTPNCDYTSEASGQSQAKPAAPAAPPKTRFIDGRTENPDDYEELQPQPPRDPSDPKPDPVKYGELTAQQILQLHLQYSYAHQQGNTTHTLVGDFLATNTMHFAIDTTLALATSGLHLLAHNHDVDVDSENPTATVDSVVQTLPETQHPAIVLSTFISEHYADHQIFDFVRLIRSCFGLPSSN
ncbi:hypothetical protein [Endozoicomonas arenosclerae]|uniref:hypothetical protein n=1 Tax=Endozoicomonas arenosclerae TaxID=1633495 RepID=UPI0012947EA9|nr:hypothetical protein [Endozoicomonas arenosclerae]